MIEKTITKDLVLEIKEEDQVRALIKAEVENVEVHLMITVEAFRSLTLDIKNYIIYIFLVGI